jgi:hypothetical protein
VRQKQGYLFIYSEDVLGLRSIQLWYSYAYAAERELVEFRSNDVASQSSPPHEVCSAFGSCVGWAWPWRSEHEARTRTGLHCMHVAPRASVRAVVHGFNSSSSICFNCFLSFSLGVVSLGFHSSEAPESIAGPVRL